MTEEELAYQYLSQTTPQHEYKISLPWDETLRSIGQLSIIAAICGMIWIIFKGK